MRVALIAGLAVLALVVGTTSVSLAAGESSSGSAGVAQYHPKPCCSLGTRESIDPGRQSASSVPFTGFPVVVLLIGGTILMAGGLVVRRAARDPRA